MPRRAADPGYVPPPESDPDQVIYRRRQQDWLSENSPAGADRRTAVRSAAIEVAKATLIARDGLTSDHSDDVGLLCTAIADEFEMDEDSQSNLVAAAQLHDIGKVGVPESILQKPGPLDAAEWEVVHEHTVVGERILSSVPELIEVAKLVRHSHEHWDGSGYPDGLSGSQIPLESRIILCADAFHAVRSPRPYRAGRAAPEAFEEIKAHSGTQFDPAVVAALGRAIEGVSERRAGGGAVFSGRAVLGNRRLVALLLTLAIGGSAFAALSERLDGGTDAEANGPILCEDCFGLPESPFAALGAKATRPAGKAGGRGGAAGRASVGTVAGAPSAGANPLVDQGPGSKVPGAPRSAPPAAGGAPGAGVGPRGNSPAKVEKPKKVKPVRPPPPRGNAYGIEKRLQNPNPPKPPPGLVRPKKNR